MTATRERRSSAQTREHVLEVAHELFYWHGIRSTGVDTIATAAQVAPTTLYRLFASKDDLVAAYVARAGEGYRQWFTAAADAGGPDPSGRILAVFDALLEQVQPGQCRGCPFLMALAETPDPAMAAHQHAVALKAWVRDRFVDLAAALGADASAGLGDHLALVFEGAYASVQALGVDGPARRARDLAERLVTVTRQPTR